MVSTLPVHILCCCTAMLVGAASASAQPLNFHVHEGRNLNLFRQDGAVAAHLVLRDGLDPRLLAAFPAGDSGVGAWFARTDRPMHWRIAGPERPETRHDAHGRLLRGISVEVETDGPKLQLTRVVMGSVRTLRDYESLHTAPAELDAPLSRQDQTFTWARDRIDGAPGYLLSVAVLDGVLEPGPGVAVRAVAGRPIRLRVLCLTGEAPLTPLGEDAILTPTAGADLRARHSLAFLSYREKLLAGSWRFDTYFGRDTLMSVRLLLPVIRPEAAEAGLGAVLERLSPLGEVAHEEDIGEFAVLDNLKAGRGRVATPVYDYKMIDADYMLAPVLSAYVEAFGEARLEAFLARRSADGARYGDLLIRNLRHVLETTRSFAAAPSAGRLLHLKPNVPVGQWRDSESGLAGGRIPYDVNAVFAPAALSAIAGLEHGGALRPYAQGAELQDAGRLAELWRIKAPPLFRTHISGEAARAAVRRFAAESGVDPALALASLPADGLSFEALSLDAEGQPIPVLNSDVGFELLFGQPNANELSRLVANVMRPFPAGLMTGVGAVVADAAFAGEPVRRQFSKAAYHGAVVWAWQEAVLIAGLDRQLARADLSAPLHEQLSQAREQIWSAVDAVGETRTSELWSWTYGSGRYQVQAFGAEAADADESNAAQLWSTVFLALKPGATADARQAEQ